MQPAENERSDGLTRDPLPPSLADRLLDQRLHVEALRGRVAHEQRGATEGPVRGGHAGCLLRGLDPGGHGRPAGGGVEERQRVDAPTEHGHTQRLEQLRGRRHVEQGFHT